jgi:hypothetical protein
MAGDSWCAEDRVVGLTCGRTVGWSLAWLWLTLCQVSRQHDPVAVALDRLRAEDAHAAGDVEAALGPLTWGEGLETVTLHGLQRFLWYELPRKWITDLDGKRHIAIALGRLLELLGLPRYAAVCRSPETSEILAAYEHSSRDGFAAFQRAEQRSGVAPPDLPELTWGPVMGMEEASGFASTAAALELAISSGDLRPGGRGWRATQQATARRHLTLPRPELDGRSRLEAVRAERLGDWARSRGRARRTLVEPLAARLADPMPLPAGADRALSRLGWLLEGAVVGLPLTQKGNLARAVVIDAVNRFDWHSLPNPPRGEGDVFELWALRELARDLGAVHRRGSRLLATPTGRTLAADRTALWRAVAGGLGAGQDFCAIVTELALAILVDGQPHAEATLIQRVGAAAAGEGWHDRSTGQPPDPEAVQAQWYALLRTLKVLSLTVEGGDWRARTVTLTPVGQATALQALHARATGPRPDPRG